MEHHIQKDVRVKFFWLVLKELKLFNPEESDLNLLIEREFDLESLKSKEILILKKYKKFLKI